MGIRTDVGEDAKGDPTRIIPQQPDPGAPVVQDEGEPLIPRVAGDRDDGPAAGREAQTPSDRKGRAEDE